MDEDYAYPNQNMIDPTACIITNSGRVIGDSVNNKAMVSSPNGANACWGSLEVLVFYLLMLFAKF